MAPLTMELLAKQDPTTSTAIIEAFQDNQVFIEYAKRTTESIINRDNEDGEKLQKGIDMAIAKGVLAAKVEVEAITKVTVEGKSVDAVGSEIIAALGDAPSRGCVMTLQGGSGTGKGETVKHMKQVVPKAQTWSNGNVFRSLTLLAVTYAEQNDCSLQDALKPDVLASFVKMLEFGEFNGKFDVKIEGLGLKYFVSDIQSTELAVERVAKNIPTVAEVTQGEVINFVQGAFAKLSGAGVNVLVEGREQTLNYIRTPHRFELVLNNPNIIGMRRAAQVMGGSAFAQLKDQPDADEAAVKAALEAALGKLGA